MSVTRLVNKYAINARTIFLVTIVLISFLLFLFGFKNRDNKYYNGVIKSHHLRNPNDVLKWLTLNYGMTKLPDTVQQYCSPKFLLEKRKHLWCDEGAIAMCTFDNRLGYKTRMIDLYGDDNISHHTVMQVFENNTWVTYDFSYHLRNVPFGRPAINRASKYYLQGSIYLYSNKPLYISAINKKEVLDNLPGYCRHIVVC